MQKAIREFSIWLASRNIPANAVDIIIKVRDPLVHDQIYQEFARDSGIHISYTPEVAATFSGLNLKFELTNRRKKERRKNA